MSAYCINTVSSPLFLSAVLMAHLSKALNVSSKSRFALHGARIFMDPATTDDLGLKKR